MGEDIQSYGFRSEITAEKVPMHPEDFRALLEWVRAKEESRRV
jgi:hypothetical protein